jgi:hypothetical protein
MGAMRAPRVDEAPPFRKALDKLRDQHPELDEALDDFKRALKLGYKAPKQRVRAQGPNVYIERMDYPALGAGGAGRFVVLFHATDANPGMSQPLQVFTLLTIYIAPDKLN